MTLRVRVDQTRCAGHGICALILGDRVDLDGWGFAYAEDGTLDDRRLRRAARRAAAACPRGAIVVEEAQGGGVDPKDAGVTGGRRRDRTAWRR